jgi:flagellar assembly protein FliH
MRTNSLSKVIKSHENDALLGVRKYSKKAFSIASDSEKISGNPTSAFPVPEMPQFSTHVDDPEKLLAAAMAQAQQTLAEAREQAEDIRRSACERGRAEGYAQGKEEGRRETDELIKTSSRVLDLLVSQLKAQEADMMRMLSPRLVDLATELARRIIHREVLLDASLVTSQAEEAVQKILEREKLIIRVNPADEQIMKAHKPSLMAMFDGIDKIEVIGDPSIEQGGCIVETHMVKVDAQPESQLQAAKRALAPEESK